MLHSVIAGIVTVFQSIAPAPPASAYVEGHVLQETRTADGLRWTYALESAGTSYTASSKEKVDVSKKAAVHFATKGNKIFLIDQGGVIHKLATVPPQ